MTRFTLGVDFIDQAMSQYRDAPGSVMMVDDFTFDSLPFSLLRSFEAVDLKGFRKELEDVRIRFTSAFNADAPGVVGGLISKKIKVLVEYPERRLLPNTF